MPIYLPSNPAPSSLGFKLLRAGTDLTAPLGGAVQRINRLGDKFKLDVTLPPMPFELGEVYVSRLLQSFASTAIIAVPQPRNFVAPFNAPITVYTSGQTGTSLELTGFTAAYTFKVGQNISIVSGSRRYFYKIVESVSVPGSGRPILTLYPPLRISPAAGDLVEIATPYFEGLIGGEEASWSVNVAEIIGLSFSLTEAR